MIYVVGYGFVRQTVEAEDRGSAIALVKVDYEFFDDKKCFTVFARKVN